ncbi:MAG: hypothetical protein RL745_611 [Actinomycetota bacterium]
MSISAATGQAIGTAAAAGGAVLAYSLIEARSYATRQREISCMRTGDQMRVLHISDLHLTPWDRDRVAWTRRLASLRPDFVVATGDFLAHQRAVAVVHEALEPLLSFPGFFVTGSNDYYAPRLKNPFAYLGSNDARRHGAQLPTGDLVEMLASGGWHNLNNRQTVVSIGGTVVHARGTDDAHIDLDDYSAVSGPYDPQAQLRLAVTHAPYSRVLTAMADDQADVILAGHTHGGQVTIPFYGALTTNCDLPTKQAKGVSSITDSSGRRTPLHVSAGLGTSPIFPVRLGCRPEAALITLR